MAYRTTSTIILDSKGAVRLKKVEAEALAGESLVHGVATVSAVSAGIDLEPEIRRLHILSIRKDGNTQHRSSVDPAIIAEYSELMRNGVVFPPIRVWWDGTYFWLSDGFQRIEAAERASLKEILAHALLGTLDDARWDSYAVNATHGVRRSSEDTARIIRRALEHPNAARIGTMELAKHLHLTEPTLRRWRTKLSSSADEDVVRLVKRGKTSYELNTSQIGKAHRGQETAKSLSLLRAELMTMKERGSPKAQRLLNVVGNWAFGRATNSACLEGIERVLCE